MNGEVDVTWSLIEKYYRGNKVVWTMDKSGIPRFSFIDESGNKIEITEWRNV